MRFFRLWLTVNSGEKRKEERGCRAAGFLIESARQTLVSHDSALQISDSHDWQATVRGCMKTAMIRQSLAIGPA